MKKLSICLVLILAICFLWFFMLSGKRVAERRGVAHLNGQSNTTDNLVTLHAKPLKIPSNTADALDPRCRDINGFETSVACLIFINNLIREIPETQSNVKNEAEGIGRILFVDDWAVLRLKYPKLPKNLVDVLYNAVTNSVGKSNKIDVVDWIRSELGPVSWEEVLQSQSSEAFVIMNRHYQWIIEDGRRPALTEVLHKLSGEFASSTLLSSPMLMDLWGYGFLKAEAQDWEHQRLAISLPLEFPRTVEERALFSQPSPKMVQAAGEEHRWSQLLHQQVFAWRLNKIFGVEDPVRILEMMDKIRFTDAHHFGWPDP